MFAHKLSFSRLVRALAVAMSLLAPRAALGAWDCGACPPAPLNGSSVRYELSGVSTFEVGCFDPCACPVLTRSGLSGSFVLVPHGADPLFTEYLLYGIDWIIPASGSGPAVHITGEGWYRVGGEFAVQQELRLCVSVNGGETQRFESGLVLGGGDFPILDIAAATSGFFCWDSVITLRAGPVPAGIAADQGPMAVRARPNPSTGPVDLELSLPQATVISLSILDIEGRSIRTLERHHWLPAGQPILRWNGLRDDGTPAPAGLYLLRLQVGGIVQTLRLIRLR